ncbi:hypothetical protein, partial [Umezakia ovalisporum]|uniref:DUF7379 domain-containing protein n=1 Tax=Umezakia ovalisporum TaxID=75695 RepID=UPI0039C6B524
ETIQAKYARYAIGFNMPDVVDGIEKNSEEISKIIANQLPEKKCFVIARSRGGLVARHLFEKKWKTESKNKPKLEKILFVATPNMGTPIANNELWKNLAKNLVNLMGKAFAVGTPALKGFELLVGAIVNKAANLPGIDNLEEESDLIISLNEGLKVKENYYAL